MTGRREVLVQRSCVPMAGAGRDAEPTAGVIGSQSVKADTGDRSDRDHAMAGTYLLTDTGPGSGHAY
ncbi:hypothetical protein [Streptomyces prunicolor]|uniref:hypothetical protein n=1 Tax=Streptomyces prunicolor TaxID=67348 RepID=UPI00341DEFC2